MSILLLYAHILYWLSIVDNIRHAFNFQQFILIFSNFHLSFSQYFECHVQFSIIHSIIRSLKLEHYDLEYFCTNPFHKIRASSNILCIMIIIALQLFVPGILLIPLWKSTNWSMTTMLRFLSSFFDILYREPRTETLENMLQLSWFILLAIRCSIVTHFTLIITKHCVHSKRNFGYLSNLLSISVSVSLLFSWTSRLDQSRGKFAIRLIVLKCYENR